MLGRAVLLSLAIAAVGCRVEPTTDAGPPPPDVPVDSPPGLDAPPRTCTSVADCNDAIPCTNDGCGVGGVCRNTPLDEMCATDERCDPAVGCTPRMPTTCTVDAECQDGSFCNGMEVCLSTGTETCYPGAPVDCDDGNPCTTETCDDATGGCVYTPICDGGMVVTTDAGVPCDDYDAATSPIGSFLVRPIQLSSCVMSGVYDIRSGTFSIAGGTLSVVLDRFTLTGTAPTGPDFHVTFSDACATFDLVGTFSCADRWDGTFTVTYSGGLCGLCTGTTATVRGQRG